VALSVLYVKAYFAINEHSASHSVSLRICDFVGNKNRVSFWIEAVVAAFLERRLSKDCNFVCMLTGFVTLKANLSIAKQFAVCFELFQSSY
jgi:hypothetical protein